MSARQSGQLVTPLSQFQQQQTWPQGRKMISHCKERISMMEKKKKKMINECQTFRSMQTQHSVDLKVSIGAGGAEAAASAWTGGAEGWVSSFGADGLTSSAAAASPESLASNLSCMAAYSSTQTNIFCLKYVLWRPSWKKLGKGCWTPFLPIKYHVVYLAQLSVFHVRHLF